MIDTRHGDMLDVLATMPAESVDAVVTDPPYGLAFMGRPWDHGVPGPDYWTACLRVLRPGGHLLAFGGTRTAHRLASAIEDAGFEIRDTITWLYGSGFPKSLNVSKAIDRARDDRTDVLVVTRWLNATVKAAGVRYADILAAFGFNPGSGMVGHWTALSLGAQPAVPTWEQWLQLRDLLGFGDEMDAEVWRLNGRKGTPGEAWGRREVIGERTTGIGTGRGATAFIGDSENRDITAPATDAARQWQGWGTALKPASEPIIVARKPLTGTVAATVQQWGTGALNVDGCRVGTSGGSTIPSGMDRLNAANAAHGYRPGTYAQGTPAPPAPSGRWPTNVVFTHTPCCGPDEVPGECVDGCPVAELDAQSGITRDGTAVQRNSGGQRIFNQGDGLTRADQGYGGQGGASRFFPTFRYQAKAPTSERPKVDGVAHPTVKPLALMRWLVRLVTPPGGLVLDPFAGSGTTGEAAVLEGMRAVLIERDESYLPLIAARLERVCAA